jgi:hypothetical protein
MMMILDLGSRDDTAKLEDHECDRVQPWVWLSGNAGVRPAIPLKVIATNHISIRPEPDPH